MNAFCPHCGRKIPNDDINDVLKVAVCRSCAEVFCFGGEPVFAAPLIRFPVSRPFFFWCWKGRRRLTIRWSWFSLSLIPFGFFGCAMTFAGGAACRRAIADNADFWPFVMGLGFLGVGLLMAISALIWCINWTDVTIERGLLRIRHRPIPVMSGDSIPIDSIEQLYCRKAEGREAGDADAFDLMARFHTGEVRQLESFSRIGHARFVEQQLEARMGLRPRRVADEYVEDIGA
ncbi:MAG TPA: hypothetical protein P5081_21235 [Phycisphaerae bacterium]|nr:hypothetical protein [Phycisphaerae bacterium]HRW55407.1 hypothetical protein [Phycisphaerae bacterium]